MSEAKEPKGEPTIASGTQNGIHLAVPTFHASASTISDAGNDISIVFGRVAPLFAGSGPSGYSVFQPLTLIYLSPEAAKDLHELLGRGLANYEAEVGEIKTRHLKASVEK